MTNFTHSAHQLYNIMFVACAFLLSLASLLCSLPVENYTFYTAEPYYIDLGKNVVDAEFQSEICKFEPSSPTLTPLSTVSVTNPHRSISTEDQVLERIRNLEAQKAQFFAIFQDYILILRGQNNIIILSKTSLKLINQYAISELGGSQKNEAFRSNDSVKILTKNNIFICNKNGYSIRSYFGPVQKAIYLNETLFAIFNPNKIQIYEIQETEIKIKKIFRDDDFRRLNKNIDVAGIQFKNCKYRSDTLYCLCRKNGLFLIDVSKLTTLSVIRKENCINFVPGNNSVYFECEVYQDYFVSSYPDTRVVSLFPSFIQEMHVFENDLLLFQHTSKLTFWNSNTKKQNEINLNDYIVQAQIAHDAVSLSFGDPNISVFVLFKGTITKYQYKLTSPALVCQWQKPIVSNITLQLIVVDGSKIMKQIGIEVVYYKRQISKLLIILLIVLGVVVVSGIVAGVCYRQLIMRNLRGLYVFLRRKRNNQGEV